MFLHLQKEVLREDLQQLVANLTDEIEHNLITGEEVYYHHNRLIEFLMEISQVIKHNEKVANE